MAACVAMRVNKWRGRKLARGRLRKKICEWEGKGAKKKGGGDCEGRTGWRMTPN